MYALIAIGLFGIMFASLTVFASAICAARNDRAMRSVYREDSPVASTGSSIAPELLMNQT